MSTPVLAETARDLVLAGLGKVRGILGSPPPEPGPPQSPVLPVWEIIWMTALVAGIPDSTLSVLQVTPRPDLDEVEGIQGVALAASVGIQSLNPV